MTATLLKGRGKGKAAPASDGQATKPSGSKAVLKEKKPADGVFPVPQAFVKF